MITDNDKIGELLDYRTQRWFVKDADTIIIANIDGFYKLERIAEPAERKEYKTQKTDEDFLDVKYKYQLGFFRLIYGKWRIEEYIGNCENSEKIANEMTKTIEFHPDFLKVNDESAEGNLYILCNLIQDKEIDAWSGNNLYPGDKNKELKEETADFYTIAKVVTRQDNKEMEKIRKQIPGEGKTIYIKDSNTIVLCAKEGYYLLKRLTYIDGVKESDLINYIKEA